MRKLEEQVQLAKRAKQEEAKETKTVPKGNSEKRHFWQNCRRRRTPMGRLLCPWQLE